MTNTNENNQQVKWSKNDWIMLGTNALLFVILFLIFDNRLPASMASHYNVHGEQDDTMAKWSFWLLYAAIGVALPTILSAMRYIDPRKKNYTRFEGYYQLMRWAISLFMHAVILLVIMDNLGYKLPAIQLVIGGLGLLWMIIGNRMGQVRSNFFVGIKTPWALSDENNWRLTHRLGARLWFIAGLIMFASAWFVPSSWTVGVLLTCVLASSLIPTVYSYILSRRK